MEEVLNESARQKQLSPDQLLSFYHNVFIADQTRHFRSLINDFSGIQGGTIVDIGGGCGFFARAVQENMGLDVRVIDNDHESIGKCKEAGVEAICCDAMDVVPRGDEVVVCFNLVLHHLVGDSDKKTQSLQLNAISRWKGCGRRVFVNEYIYESYLGNVSGWLIYQITKSRAFSAIGKLASRLIPAFRANTFGVGVRFRAHDEWKDLFARGGFSIVGVMFGKNEVVALPLRLLLIKAIRRDSYLLC